MRKALYKAFGAVEKHVYEPVPPSPPDEPPPEGYYKLIWYITRWRWRFYVYYSARVRDSARWQKFSRVIRIWGEGTKATDGYSTATASLVVRNLAEAPSAVDAHTIDVDDRVVVNLHEYPSALDGHEVESYYDFRRWLDEEVSVADAVNWAAAHHVVREYNEATAVSDALSRQVKGVLERNLYETARVHETPLARYEREWPGPEADIWYQYYIFEKALVDDAHVSDVTIIPKRFLGETVHVGDEYSYDIVNEVRELFETVHVGDGYSYDIAPWLDGFDYRKSHEIEGSTAGEQTDYQVEIVVYYDKGHGAKVEDTTLYFEASDYDLDGNLFAGIGTEFGAGKIYKSENDGETWIEVFAFPSAPTDYRPKNCRTVFVAANGYIYVSGGRGTIYRSIDGGDNFTKVHDEAIASNLAEFWNMAEDSSGNLYVGLHYSQTPPLILKSIDDGASWSSTSPAPPWGTGDINCVAVNPANDWIYVANDGGVGYAGIWRSKDGGASWTWIVSILNGGAISPWRLAICHDQKIFLGTERAPNRIGYITDDGTAGPFVPTTVKTLGDYPVMWGRYFNEELWFGTAHTGGAPAGSSQVVRSIDGGTTWEEVDAKPNPTQRRSFYFTTAHPERQNKIFPTKTTYNRRIIVGDADYSVGLGGKCRNDFGDVRFTVDGTELDYWIREKVDGDYAIFMVEIPTIPASPDTVTIYVYYGKDDATTTSTPFSEDFTGYTEVDEFGKITVTASRVSWAAVIRNETSYVWKDYEADHFGDFRVELTVNISDSEAGDASDVIYGVVFAVANATGVTSTIYLGDTIYVSLIEDGANDDKFRFSLVQRDGGVLQFNDDDIVRTIGTYYMTIERDGTSITCKIYSDSKRESLLTTLSGVGVAKAYRYLQALTSAKFAADPNDHYSGYDENLYFPTYVDPEPAHGDWGAEESI